MSNISVSKVEDFMKRCVKAAELSVIISQPFNNGKYDDGYSDGFVDGMETMMKSFMKEFKEDSNERSS